LGKLIYSAIASLDGYVADPEGKFGPRRTKRSTPSSTT
jgi:hypothetical protein